MRPTDLLELRHDCLSPEHLANLTKALENVPQHVKEAERSASRTLPVALSILVPSVARGPHIKTSPPPQPPSASRNEEGAAAGVEDVGGQGKAGGGHGQGGDATEGDAGRVRGRAVDISVTNLEMRTVGDLLDQVSDEEVETKEKGSGRGRGLGERARAREPERKREGEREGERWEREGERERERERERGQGEEGERNGEASVGDLLE